MKILFYACALTLSSFLLSCNSGELSREKAKALIIEKFKFPYNEQQEYSAHYAFDANAERRYPLDKLQELGLLTYHKDNWYLLANITDKGKEFIIDQHTKELSVGGVTNVYTLKTCEIDLIEVTGIQTIPNQNIAEVSYSVKRTVNPFGEYLFKLTNDIITRKAIFKKFDDGWRLD